MQTPDMLKIPESGLIHLLLYRLRYKKILTTTRVTLSQNKTQPERYYQIKARLQAFVSNVLAAFIIVE